MKYALVVRNRALTVENVFKLDTCKAWLEEIEDFVDVGADAPSGDGRIVQIFDDVTEASVFMLGYTDGRKEACGLSLYFAGLAHAVVVISTIVACWYLAK